MNFFCFFGEKQGQLARFRRQYLNLQDRWKAANHTLNWNYAAWHVENMIQPQKMHLEAQNMQKPAILLKNALFHAETGKSPHRENENKNSQKFWKIWEKF